MLCMCIEMGCIRSKLSSKADQPNGTGPAQSPNNAIAPPSPGHGGVDLPAIPKPPVAPKKREN